MVNDKVGNLGAKYCCKSSALRKLYTMVIYNHDRLETGHWL